MPTNEYNIQSLDNTTLLGATSTATSAGTTTLTVASTLVQVFTGSTTHTVKLPTTSVPAGHLPYTIVNQSSGAVTVQSSGANTIATLAANSVGRFIPNQATPTTAAHWNFEVFTFGKGLTVSNSLTLAGTDGTTMTFPSTSATVARTDAANTFTGHQTIEGVTSTGATGTGKFVFDTSPTLVTPLLGTPTSGTLTNCTGLPLGGLAAAAYNTTPTASTLAEWDSSKNLSANAFTPQTTSTATAGGTTTMDITYTQVQVWTGSSNQTIKLPTTSVSAFAEYRFINQSSGTLTIQSSGGNTVATLAANGFATFVAQKATPTAAADWGVTGLASLVAEYTSTTAGVTVPSGVTGVWIESMIGPGGGGASGRRGAAGTVRCGGGGGGTGGMVTNYFVPAARLSTTVTLTLPAGLTGGAAVTSNDTDGNPGGSPTVASFASGSFTLQTWIGAPSTGGTNALGTGGIGATAQFNGVSGGSASTTGGTGNQGQSPASGVPSGGGAGGGITSGDTANAGGAGGYQLQYYATGTVGSAGVVGGASPGAGAAAIAGVGGLGAGGGAASTTGAAQAGADATGYGAGGGGGGASLNGNNSGKGGNGGGSYCRLRWVWV